MTNPNDNKPVRANKDISAADNHQQGNGQKPASMSVDEAPGREEGDDPSPDQEEQSVAQDGKKAARGDDDLMSQPQQTTDPAGKQSRWQQQLSDAKNTWSKLSNDELLKSEGEEQKLTTLVQQRYAISRDEAGRQVKRFISNANAR